MTARGLALAVSVALPLSAGLVLAQDPPEGTKIRPPQYKFSATTLAEIDVELPGRLADDP